MTAVRQRGKTALKRHLDGLVLTRQGVFVLSILVLVCRVGKSAVIRHLGGQVLTRQGVFGHIILVLVFGCGFP